MAKILDIKKSLLDELTSYLVIVDAETPTIDETYDENLRQEWLTRQKHELLPKLEKGRRRMLSNDYLPNVDWWGSKKNEARAE